jgi:hypothetical protein
METVTGTALPVAEPAGVSTFTWYSPTNPGTAPAKSTRAGFPPIDTVGAMTVADSGALVAADPLGG